MKVVMLLLTIASATLCLEAIGVDSAIISKSSDKTAKLYGLNSKVPDKDDDIVISVSEFTPNFTWTRERMLSARPIRFPVYANWSVFDDLNLTESDATTNDELRRFKRQPSVGNSQNGREWSDAEEESAAPRSLPHISQDFASKLGLKQKPPPSVGSAGGPNFVSSRMFRPPSRVVEADVNTAPYDIMGRLFFSDEYGNQYTCSGQYVADRVVLTAAHCVYDLERAEFNRDFMFMQQYNNGHGIKRRVKHQIVYAGWRNHAVSNPQFAYDFAFLAMEDPSASGSHMDLDSIDSYGQVEALGYPSNYRRGKILQSYKGYKGEVTPNVVELEDDPMAEGCSGGAWVVNSDGAYKAVGLNSFSIDGVSSMYSPRFKVDRLQKLLNEASRQVDN